MYRFCLFPIVVLVSPLLVAQTTTSTGAVEGSVFDASGGSVPHVRITLRLEETGWNRSVETDRVGRFAIRGLTVGAYTLRLSAAGFNDIRVKPFPVSVGQIVAMRFELLPAGVASQLEVREEPDAIDVTASTSSATLGYERIEEAPARSRNYLNFILAAPGAAPTAGASSQRTMTGTRSPLGDSGFTFGGIRPRNNGIQIDGLDNRDETTGGNRVAIGLEMVQEFRLSGIAVGAESGGAAGGLLNLVTRSGTNQWHGDVTFFAQHEITNAQRTEVSSTARPRFRRQQPGVSANGPLRRDRTFIAGAVEYENESAEEWSNVSPTALASVPGTYRGLYPTSTRGTEGSAKFNHQASEKDAFSTRYAYSRGRVRAEVQGPDNFADRSAQGNSLTIDHSLVGNWLRVATPSVVNDLRFQVAARQMELRPNAPGAMWEIPGAVTLGGFYRLNSNRTERHFQLADNLNFVLGHHRLSVGSDAHLVQLDATFRNRYAGVFVFPSLQDFRLGRPDLFIQAFGDPRTAFNTIPVGAWLQDRWELRPRLLLELGARFDRQAMPSGVSPSSNNVAPRLGLAWRPSAHRPLVFRLGTGLFYDRYPLAFLNDALQKDGIRGFEQYAVGPDAVRAWDLGRGATLLNPLPGLAPSTYRTATDFSSPYSRKLSAGAEYGLGKDTSISLEASHVRGFHLPRTRNTTGTLPPRYELETTGRSAFTGATVSLNRRMRQDLTYLIGYTVGRTRDDASDFDEQPNNPLNIRRDWARSRQHQAHRLAASAVFELPGEWLEGISWAPILTLGSGRPINALLTTDTNRTGAYPLSARPVGLGRNPFFSPPTRSLDLRVMKTWKVHDGRAVLQLGIESFNLTNHSNVERVSQFYAGPQGRLDSYGSPLESLPGRQVQFLMQFEF